MVSLAAMLPLLGILDVLEDLGFVVKIIVFTYIVFWLYMQFRESQLLFAISAIIAAYFILIQPIPTLILVIIFVVFVTMGWQLQMLLQFGLFPVLRFFGVELEHPEWAEQQKMQAIQDKLRKGQELSHEEEDYLRKEQQKDMEYQKKMEERMMRK